MPVFRVSDLKNKNKNKYHSYFQIQSAEKSNAMGSLSRLPGRNRPGTSFGSRRRSDCRIDGRSAGVKMIFFRISVSQFRQKSVL